MEAPSTTDKILEKIEKLETAPIAEKIDLLQAQLPLILEWSTRMLSAVLILIAGWVIGNWLSRRIHSIKRLDETLKMFLGGTVRYLVFAIAVITILAQFGVQTASLLALLGAAGLAIGLALQGTLSNVAAGTMLLVLRPFKVGDYITAGGIGGTVKALGLFGTEMATPDNVYIFVPNSKIWNEDIWNYNRNLHRRQDINVSISYDDNIDKAFGIIKKILEKDDRVLQDPEDKQPEVMMDRMADFSVEIIVRFWCRKEDYWHLRWELTKKIKEDFDKGGITIPYPTQLAIHKEVK